MMELLYLLVMGMIRAWEAVTWVIYYIIQRHIKQLTVKKFARVGVTINGKEDQDIVVYDEKFYHRLAQDKTLGLGESYMDGWWESKRLDQFMCNIIRGGLFASSTFMLPYDRLSYYLQFNLFNLQTAKRSWEVAEKHYNLGNKLFESFLDRTMNYSCGYWKDAKDLNEAQQHKMELIGRKLKLKSGMRVLDIGCGWGGLCKYLAEKHHVSVVGITVSKEGAKIAEERCKGLPVQIRVQDYRDLKNEQFDRIVSVGMFEHVGRVNYRTFFKVADECLSDGGIFLLHTIGVDSNKVPYAEPWTNKYIFPNGILPCHKNIPSGIHNLFTIEDWHNFGADYDKTLMAWYGNFVKNWPTIQHLFDDPQRFYRMWSYYLLAAAGIFRARKFQLWQIVLAKNGIPGGYASVR